MTLTNRFLVTTVLIFSLSGCVTAMVAGAAVATIDVLADRRTVGNLVDDSGIELKISDHLISMAKRGAVMHVSPTSVNGVVLLTGEVDYPASQQAITDYAKTLTGVVQVVDETVIDGKVGLSVRSSDTWITTKVKTKLVANTGLDADRVKVVTSRGIVYLMGIVTRDEGSLAADIASSVTNVVRVVKVFEYK